MTNDERTSLGWTEVSPGRWRLPDATPDRAALADLNDPRPDPTLAAMRAAGGVPTKNVNRAKGAWRPHARPTADGYTLAESAPTPNLPTLRDARTGVVTFPEDGHTAAHTYALHEERVTLARLAWASATPQTFAWHRPDGSRVEWTAHPDGGYVTTARTAESVRATLPRARTERALAAERLRHEHTVASWHPITPLAVSARPVAHNAGAPRGWSLTGNYTGESAILAESLARISGEWTAHRAATSAVWSLVNARRSVEAAHYQAARRAAFTPEERAMESAAAKRRVAKMRAKRDAVDFAKGARKLARAGRASAKQYAKRLKAASK